MAHDDDVMKLSEEVKQRIGMDNTIQGYSKSTHMMRNTPKGLKGLKLDVKGFNRILDIDIQGHKMVVEPGITMEQMAAATIPLGYIPPVIAEFKNITAGGAVIGTSLESSSHLFGQFNNSCIAYEVLLGDGSVVRASKEENSDLYYGLPGSFGSLGVLLSIELNIVPTTGWVKITCSRFDSVKQALEWMNELHLEEDPPDYIEGLVYSEKDVAVIAGRHSIHDTELDQGVPKISLGSYCAPWFYQVVHGMTGGLKAGEFKEGLLSAHDYLFRYDRGAFWMGSYALHGSLLLRFITENWGWTPKWLQRIPYSNYAKLKYPGKIFRGLWGWICTSQSLYKILHFGREGWFGKKSIVQDFYIPGSKTESFVKEVLKQTSITPLWLCPIKTVGKEEFFGPHAIEGELAFDVGVYGFPKLGEREQESAIALCQGLEKSAQKLGGRKMLYSYSFYTEENFWKIYDKNKYGDLRKKYKAEGVWADIAEKVLKGPE